MELIETVRVERGRAVLLPYHYDRLRRGALGLEFKLPFSEGEFEELLIRKWEEEGGGELLIRFTLKENGSFELSARECRKRERVRLKSIYGVKRCFSAVSPYKTSISARTSALALKEAQKLGYDEALTYSAEGFVSECAYANIFFVKEGVLFTPSLKSGCLEGTRRRFVIETAKEMGVPVIEGLFTVRELLTADEVFLTNAREDACPVVEVDGFKLKELPGKPFYSRIREVIEWREFKAKGAQSP